MAEIGFEPSVFSSTTPHGGAVRAPAMGCNGMVASAHPLASVAGLRALLQGGNAVDAALAVAAALNVVEPFMSGMGGGGGHMLIYWAGAAGQPRPAEAGTHALSYLGHNPRAADAKLFSGQEAMQNDVRAGQVPCHVAGWLAAHERFGSLPRAELFAPAIELAERGFPVSPFQEGLFASAERKLARWPSSAAVFLPRGRAPREGEVLVQKDLGRSLRAVAEGGADAFYRGELGERFVRVIQEAGGLITRDDLLDAKSAWTGTVECEYQGQRLVSLAPPCNSFQIFETIKIFEGFEPSRLGHNSADYLHLLLESIKLASADRTRYVFDPEAPISALLSDGYAAARRKLIDPRRAAPSEGERYVAHKDHGEVPPGDPWRYQRDNTTHFDTADRWGNVVSVTHTNGGTFGTGFVAGDTGICLNNQMYWADLDPESPNYLKPGNKVSTSMSPCHVYREGRPVLAIGTPGSFGILQTTAQMLLNVLAHGMNVQAAIEAPRVRAFERTIVDVENRVPEDVRQELARRGHELVAMPAYDWKVGGGHGIAINPQTGAYTGGADPRRDGAAIGF